MPQPLHLDHSDQTVPFKDLSFHKKLALVKEIIFNSIPNIAAYIVTPIINITNVYFLSKNHGDEVVAGYGLGVVYTAAFVTTLILCFNQAGNILMAQAYGAKNYRSCGIYFQKSAILLAILIVPLLLTLLFADKIMMTFSIEQNLAEIVGEYARVSLPSFIGAAAFDLMKAFITSQKVFYPIIYIQVSNLLLHFFWTKLFIDWLQMGIAGAALSKVIEDWTITIMIYLYIRFSNRFTETWFPWARESFNKESLWTQAKFSLPIAAMTSIAWLYFEFMTMISGTFGAQYVVAHVAIANTSLFCYTLSLGISVTMIAYTANAIGKGAIIEAKNYFYAGISIIITIAASLIVTLLSLQNVWVGIWSTDPDTQAYLIEVFTVFCLGSMWTDALINGQLGLLKAVGKQNIASLIVFTALYPIGVPLMIFLTFVLDYKVKGLWLSFGIANVTQVVWSLLKILKIDWKKVIEDSKKRLKAEESVQLVEMGRSSDLEKSESLLH